LTFPSDIWALGCLFSLVATWMVLNKSGVAQFNRIRRRAIQKIIFSQLWEKRDVMAMQFGMPHDFFHNGREILPAVTEWHALLRKILRAGDPLTGRVLDLAENRMLLGDQHERITAKQLVSELSEMAHLDKAPMDSHSEDIYESLLAMEHEEEEKAIIMKHYRTRSFDMTVRSDGDTDSISIHSQGMIFDRRRSSTESRGSEALSPPPIDQSTGRQHSPTLKPDDVVMNTYFKSREVIFVIDNGATMGRHWATLNNLLGDLATKVGTLSDVMPKFLFTRELSWMTFRQIRSVVITKMMMGGGKMPSHTGQTDMAKALEKVAEDYLKNMPAGGRQNSRLNPLTIIVLTDCIWQAMRNKDDVLNPIKKIADKINSQPQLQAKFPLRVEFVQYGGSSTITDMLRRFKQAAVEKGMQ
jgi:hypothetical protein